MMQTFTTHLKLLIESIIVQYNCYMNNLLLFFSFSTRINGVLLYYNIKQEWKYFYKITFIFCSIINYNYIYFIFRLLSNIN